LQSRPIFKAPAPRASLLGLDKLAQQKRDAEASKAAHATKKVKLDYDNEEDTALEPETSK
jgi:pre-mRNA-splicing factor ATP-dependent RNA helicase DHX38/PRP16